MTTYYRRHPVYLTVSQVVKLLGDPPDWSYLRVWRWLRREGCLRKRAGTAVTTMGLLRARFPELWDRIEQEHYERTEGYDT